MVFGVLRWPCRAGGVGHFDADVSSARRRREVKLGAIVIKAQENIMELSANFDSAPVNFELASCTF